LTEAFRTCGWKSVTTELRITDEQITSPRKSTINSPSASLARSWRHRVFRLPCRRVRCYVILHSLPLSWGQVNGSHLNIAARVFVLLCRMLIADVAGLGTLRRFSALGVSRLHLGTSSREEAWRCARIAECLDEDEAMQSDFPNEADD
jgi:hypothetical protein